MLCENRCVALIRMAKATDARGLAEVRVRGWQVGYEGIVDAGFLSAMSVDQNEERWAEIIEARGEQIRVAIVQGRVVGFASSGPYRVESGNDKTLNTTVFAEPGSIGELYGFYVHPDSWGTGVADELHDHALNTLRADGWMRLKLWVLADNARARRFYERHGWTADGASETLSIPGAPLEVRCEMVVAG